MLIMLFLFALSFARAEDCPTCAPKVITPPVSELAGNVKTISTTLNVPEGYRESLPPARELLSGPIAVCSAVSATQVLGWCNNEREHHAFKIKNEKSPRINPVGNGVYRSFEFTAPQNARQDMALEIEESGCSDGYECNDSEWSMETILVFFPRKVIPGVKLLDNGILEATLPTGEKVLFSAEHGEITGGALAETTPIDRSRNRHTRKFAGLSYSGKGIMIRSDQRAESTRDDVVWGQKKRATVTWGRKTCTVSPSDIWIQNKEGGGANRHTTDESFYAMLRTKCKWEVSAKDFL